MTIFAGEELKISSTLTDFDGAAMTNLNVTSVVIEIFDSVPTRIVDDTMSWDNTNEYWYYLWDTTGLTAGSYKAKVTATGIDGLPSFEWSRIRLSREPITLP